MFLNPFWYHVLLQNNANENRIRRVFWGWNNSLGVIKFIFVALYNLNKIKIKVSHLYVIICNRNKYIEYKTVTQEINYFIYFFFYYYLLVRSHFVIFAHVFSWNSNKSMLPALEINCCCFFSFSSFFPFFVENTNYLEMCFCTKRDKIS